LRHYFIIFGHELRMLLVNASTYIAAVLFLALMGFLFAAVLTEYTSAPQDLPPSTVFFKLFWVPVFFVVPLLTMKCLAEERRLGTLETLLTAPVSVAEVVLAKFSAAYVFYLGLWSLTGGFFWVMGRYAGPDRAAFLEIGPLAGGYLFVAVSGLMFVAIGVFASSLTRHQAVAGIITVVTILLLVFVPRFALNDMAFLKQPAMHSISAGLDYMLVFRHLDDFNKGIVDFREVLYYVSGAALALIFSVFSLELKLLHG
jgi:ABC-2 type transport system permease protein